MLEAWVQAMYVWYATKQSCPCLTAVLGDTRVGGDNYVSGGLYLSEPLKNSGKAEGLKSADGWSYASRGGLMRILSLVFARVDTVCRVNVIRSIVVPKLPTSAVLGVAMT